MKLSLIVPHWPKEPHHDELLKTCLQSMEADEKIVIVNDGTGMGTAINKGLAVATGDYFVVSNNDCKLVEGSLSDMCDPDCITIPDAMEGQWDKPRSFYCMPRWVYELVGGYDETFDEGVVGGGYHADDDLIRRWQNAGIQFKPTKVKVDHKPGTTLDTLHNRDEVFKKAKERYEQKWQNQN